MSPQREPASPDSHSTADPAAAPPPDGGAEGPQRASQPPIQTTPAEELATNRQNPEESAGTSPIENRSNTPEAATGADRLVQSHEVGETDPDLQWVLEAQNGNREAFTHLVERHQGKLYTRIYYMVHDAEWAADLVQEAFLKVFRGLHLFRGEARFSTWIHRIAVNVTLHHFERQRAQKRSGNVVSLSAMRGQDSAEFEIADETMRPDTRSELSEQQQVILKAMSELDPQYRTALSLREIQGYSYQEIERVMEIPIGTVKSKIFRARQILQEKLKGLL